MKGLSRFVNPLIAFIAIQLVWVVLLVLWIVWFVRSHQRLRAVAERFSPELVQGEIEWFILVEGIVLLVAILVGVYVIFLFWQRQAALLRAQRNFIAQVSHELKSPLASLRLHLETIRRRPPGPDKMMVFVDTMLADTDRLGSLIDNLLSAGRFELRGVRLNRERQNLSALVSGFFGRYRFALPRAGKMELAIEPDLHADIDAGSIETALRNLLENAILYSDGAPTIRISLRREGRWAHLEVADRGKGLERKELKKVLGKFYRVRRSGETVRGSGLGLFIVQAVVRLHRGKIWLESDGPGRGLTVHLRLPLAPEEERR